MPFNDKHFNDKQKMKRQYGYSEIKIKVAAFCAYRERTQQEVRDKLYSYGLHSDEVEELISFYITENFVNEERFAKAYAGGKFRINKWGRNKILKGLQQHRLSNYCIKSGMAEIDPEEYYETLRTLAAKKSQSLNETDPFKKKYKISQYLFGKGYEQDLVWEVVNEIVDNE